MISDPTTPISRIRRLNQASTRRAGDYVLYWMIACPPQRLQLCVAEGRRARHKARSSRSWYWRHCDAITVGAATGSMLSCSRACATTVMTSIRAR